jgi:hypothetical protein
MKRARVEREPWTQSSDPRPRSTMAQLSNLGQYHFTDGFESNSPNSNLKTTPKPSLRCGSASKAATPGDRHALSQFITQVQDAELFRTSDLGVPAASKSDCGCDGSGDCSCRHHLAD